MIAAEKGHRNCVSILLANGADVDLAHEVFVHFYREIKRMIIRVDLLYSLS